MSRIKYKSTDADGNTVWKYADCSESTGGIPSATYDVPGLVSVGETLSVSNDGKLNTKNYTMVYRENMDEDRRRELAEELTRLIDSGFPISSIKLVVEYYDTGYKSRTLNCEHYECFYSKDYTYTNLYFYEYFSGYTYSVGIYDGMCGMSCKKTDCDTAVEIADTANDRKRVTAKGLRDYVSSVTVNSVDPDVTAPVSSGAVYEAIEYAVSRAIRNITNSN